MAQKATPPAAVVVIGASAGGLAVLQQLVGALPASLPAAVLAVLHTTPSESRLPQILSRAGPLPARHPENDEPLEQGLIYVAPPDCHLLVDRDRMRVVKGPQENGHRPAIDPLFRSAATAYRARTVAVVLSGTLDDGAAGCAAVARHGGTVVVQDPSEALFPSMPLSAIAADHPEHVVGVARMGEVVRQAVERAGSSPMGASRDEKDGEEAAAAELRFDPRTGVDVGTQSPFSCPTCGGVLQELEDAASGFRCRVGHAFGPESLLTAQTEGIEDALWTALRALQERSQLAARIARRLRERGHEELAARYDRMVEEADRGGRVIRELLLGRDAGSR
jgi:two-component system chemotaxis response regulator CheB